MISWACHVLTVQNTCMAQETTRVAQRDGCYALACTTLQNERGSPKQKHYINPQRVWLCAHVRVVGDGVLVGLARVVGDAVVSHDTHPAANAFQVSIERLPVAASLVSSVVLLEGAGAFPNRAAISGLRVSG